MNKAFEKEDKYKLYRTVREILHPTISKKNISNYKIIVDDNLLPLRIFYPQKVTNMSKVIIFIHGDIVLTKCKEKYAEISTNIAMNTDNLVISIDHEELEKISKKKYINKIYDTTKYLIEELNKQNINDIKLLGDSTGSTTILNFKEQLKENNYNLKYILFYPVLSSKYITKKLKTNKELYDDSLIIIGNKDEYFEEIKTYTNNYVEIPNMNHGFLKEQNTNIRKIYIDAIKEFIKE